MGAALGSRSVDDAEKRSESGRQHGGERPAGVVGGGGDGGDGAAEVGLQGGDSLAFDGFGVEQRLRDGEGGGEAAHLEVEGVEVVVEEVVVEVEVEVVEASWRRTSRISACSTEKCENRWPTFTQLPRPSEYSIVVAIW